MANTTYRINKGINKSIEFRGLKAQYIWYLGGVVVAGMVVFAILYISGVSAYLCVPGVLGGGTFGVSRVYQLSHKYGEFGMMKKMAQQNVPKVVHTRSRRLFMAKS